jgi:hypothetical protein
MGMVAPLAPTYTVSDQPLPELLDSIPDMVFLAITFGSVVGMEASLVLTYAASDPIPPELCTYSAAALLRAYYPFDGGSPTEVPSLRISVLFFLRGAVRVVIAPAPLGGDREPTFAAALDVITYSFCHTPFREIGNEASIRVPRMFKSHAWQQYDKQMQCY